MLLLTRFPVLVAFLFTAPCMSSIEVTIQEDRPSSPLTFSDVSFSNTRHTLYEIKYSTRGPITSVIPWFDVEYQFNCVTDTGDTFVNNSDTSADGILGLLYYTSIRQFSGLSLRVQSLYTQSLLVPPQATYIECTPRIRYTREPDNEDTLIDPTGLWALDTSSGILFRTNPFRVDIDFIFTPKIEVQQSTTHLSGYLGDTLRYPVRILGHLESSLSLQGWLEVGAPCDSFEPAFGINDSSYPPGTRFWLDLGSGETTHDGHVVMTPNVIGNFSCTGTIYIENQ